MEYFSKFESIKSVLIKGEVQTHHTLSVVIPTYNKPTALKRAIQSAIDQQDVSIDYNIVVVENYEGEVDEVLSMLSSLSNPHNIQICYYKNEKNIGMHANWNRCFEMADADYAIMLHTDDFFLPLCVHYAEAAIRKGIPVLTINRMSLRHGDTKIDSRIKSEEQKQVQELKHSNIPFYIEKPIDILVGIVPVAPTGFLANKGVFMSSGGFKTKEHTWPADLELAFNLSREGKLFFCDRYLVVKTEGDGNDGSNLKSTVPLVKYDNELFHQVANNLNIPFRKHIIGMRMAGIIRAFGIDYNPYMYGVFPEYYQNKYWRTLYRYLCKIQRRIMINRK